MKGRIPSLLLGALLTGPALAETVTEEAITLRTETGNLHGSLMLPGGKAPVPVALIIAGSGPTDRDGNQMLAKNNSLRMLAEALAKGGIASVRYDKRGVGASAPALRSEADMSYSDLVNDAAAWAAQLADDERFSRIVIVGHSAGSTIGLLAAQRSQTGMYVSIAGPATNAASSLRWQLRGRLPAELADRNEAILLSLERGERVESVPPELMALYRPTIQPFLIDVFKVIPTDELRKLRIPCLIVQGDTDIQVPVSSALKLRAAKPDAALSIIEGMNHVLKQVPNDPERQLASYSDPSLPIAPGLSSALIKFILSTATRANP